MDANKLFFFSKGYKTVDSAGNKAKIDAEEIISKIGFENIGVANCKNLSSIGALFVTLFSIIKLIVLLPRESILFMQYPLNKYYHFVTAVARMKRCKITLLIHDLGAMRRAKLTVEQERDRLNRVDCIICHNKSMKQWLIESGVDRPIVCNEIFDFLSEANSIESRAFAKPLSICYAGSLEYRKAGFLHADHDCFREIPFHIYGGGFPEEAIGSRSISYYGFSPYNDFISSAKGSIALVWGGTSIECCDGDFGAYLAYNAPHKTSMYIRAHLPIIIYSGAAMADFVTRNGIGWSIDSLVKLPALLDSIDEAEYDRCSRAVCEMDLKLREGYFLTAAIKEALNLL